MIQAKVPKFIDIEDRVIGPLTLMQFFYLAVPAALIVILKAIAPFPVFIVGLVVFGGLGFALAFVRVSERPFIYFLFAAFRYAMNPHRYSWGRVEQKVKFMPEKAKAKVAADKVPKTGAWSAGRIRELAEQLEREEDVRKRNY